MQMRTDGGVSQLHVRSSACPRPPCSTSRKTSREPGRL